mmetsp:Transcript_25778/g.86609  ORF Transcript_25778/g.86609 Transcript_25778/m.86609 type:complete len:234 (-) Transcript_25778:326-1027(-)
MVVGPREGATAPAPAAPKETALVRFVWFVLLHAHDLLARRLARVVLQQNGARRLARSLLRLGLGRQSLGPAGFAALGAGERDAVRRRSVLEHGHGTAAAAARLEVVDEAGRAAPLEPRLGVGTDLVYEARGLSGRERGGVGPHARAVQRLVLDDVARAGQHVLVEEHGGDGLELRQERRLDFGGGSRSVETVVAHVQSAHLREAFPRCCSADHSAAARVFVAEDVERPGGVES